MTKKELQKIKQEVIRVMMESVPAFFGPTEPSPQDLLYETRAQMITDVEMYFYDLMKNEEAIKLIRM